MLRCCRMRPLSSWSSCYRDVQPAGVSWDGQGVKGGVRLSHNCFQHSRAMNCSPLVRDLCFLYPGHVCNQKPPELTPPGSSVCSIFYPGECLSLGARLARSWCCACASSCINLSCCVLLYAGWYGSVCCLCKCCAGSWRIPCCCTPCSSSMTCQYTMI